MCRVERSSSLEGKKERRGSRRQRGFITPTRSTCWLPAETARESVGIQFSKAVNAIGGLYVLDNLP